MGSEDANAHGGGIMSLPGSGGVPGDAPHRKTF
jgi:hypothetical protein